MVPLVGSSIFAVICHTTLVENKCLILPHSPSFNFAGRKFDFTAHPKLPPALRSAVMHGVGKMLSPSSYLVSPTNIAFTGNPPTTTERFYFCFRHFRPFLRENASVPIHLVSPRKYLLSLPRQPLSIFTIARFTAHSWCE